MIDPVVTHQVRSLEPVQAEEQRTSEGPWTRWLVVFLRVMSALSLIKGLYHWSVVCGIIGGSNGFASHAMPWQAATVFFAVIDLVAAVGLWLLAAWGAVVWLTASISMAAVQVFFPEIYGGQIEIIAIEGLLLACYLMLAIMSAREHPQ